MGMEEGNPLRPVTPSAKTRFVGEHFDSENRAVMDWSSLKAEAVKLAASSFLRVFVVVGGRQKWRSQSPVVLEFLGVVFQRGNQRPVAQEGFCWKKMPRVSISDFLEQTNNITFSTILLWELVDSATPAQASDT